MTITELQQRTDERFDFILEDDEGQIIFAAPMPLEYAKTYGLSYAITEKGFCIGTEDFGVFEDAWDKYATDLMAKARAVPGSEPESNAAAKRKRKTKSRNRARQINAYTSDDMPDYIANITLKPYQQSMTLVPNDTAHLRPIIPQLVDQLRLQDNGIGTRLTDVDEEYYDTDDLKTIASLDLPTLRAIYTIILNDVRHRARTPGEIMALVKDQSYITRMTSIYLPDFLRMIGYKSSVGPAAVEYAILKIKGYYRIDGVIKEEYCGRTYRTRYAVLNFDHYDEKTGTLHFYSPYLHKLIAMILNSSMRIDDATQLPKTSAAGDAVLGPSCTKTIRNGIVNERNKRAVEIVFIIDALIAEAGRGMPQISAYTIIERCPDLKNALEAAATTSDKNKLLRRTFSKAWELLETQTKLKETYKNIQFVTGIPKAGSLEMIFKFPHQGRIKDEEKPGRSPVSQEPA